MVTLLPASPAGFLTLWQCENLALTTEPHGCLHVCVVGVVKGGCNSHYWPLATWCADSHRKAAHFIQGHDYVTAIASTTRVLVSSTDVCNNTTHPPWKCCYLPRFPGTCVLHRLRLQNWIFQILDISHLIIMSYKTVDSGQQNHVKYLGRKVAFPPYIWPQQRDLLHSMAPQLALQHIEKSSAPDAKHRYFARPHSAWLHLWLRWTQLLFFKTKGRVSTGSSLMHPDLKRVPYTCIRRATSLAFIQQQQQVLPSTGNNPHYWQGSI